MRERIKGKHTVDAVLTALEAGGCVVVWTGCRTDVPIHRRGPTYVDRRAAVLQFVSGAEERVHDRLIERMAERGYFDQALPQQVRLGQSCVPQTVQLRLNPEPPPARWDSDEGKERRRQRGASCG